jgi:flavin reductase (DIM6/NTAB) family NADH-FMN oxidoreductase RutF
METRNAVKAIQGREIAALLNPRAVVLVTCCDAEGRPNVLTIAWHTPLSHDPPLVGISVGLSRYSHSLIETTREFVINVVSTDCRAAVEICGQNSGRECDKFALASLKLRPASLVRPPLIAQALGTLECKVVDRLACGDHTFFTAEVLAAATRLECFGDAWQPPHGDVLLCWQRDRFGTCTKVDQP